MPTLPRPNYPSREIEDLARIFEYFGEIECPQLDAHLYRALCRGVASDKAVLALAAHAPPTQPPPNLLFASAHYLLLQGVEHPLRDFYPEFDGARSSATAEAYPVFRDFCLAHRTAIEGLVQTRMTQTNVVQRTSGLLPAFAAVAARSGGAALSLVEVGASAGLNLQWDQFRYEYQGEGASKVAWGDAGSPVLVPCELRGVRKNSPRRKNSPSAEWELARPERELARDIPARGVSEWELARETEWELPRETEWDLPREIPVAWRRGIDLNPISLADEDALMWLRALVWPEHTAAQDRLRAAILVARRDPPRVVAGDAAVGLPALLAEAPSDTALCVYGTHTLYQFPRDALLATLKAMQDASRERPIDFLSIEGTGDRHSELRWTRYRDGRRETVLAGRCNPHGYWLEWLGGAGSA